MEPKSALAGEWVLGARARATTTKTKLPYLRFQSKITTIKTIWARTENEYFFISTILFSLCSHRYLWFLSHHDSIFVRIAECVCCVCSSRHRFFAFYSNFNIDSKKQKRTSCRIRNTNGVWIEKWYDQVGRLVGRSVYVNESPVRIVFHQLGWRFWLLRTHAMKKKINEIKRNLFEAGITLRWCWRRVHRIHKHSTQYTLTTNERTYLCMGTPTMCRQLFFRLLRFLHHQNHNDGHGSRNYIDTRGKRRGETHSLEANFFFYFFFPSRRWLRYFSFFVFTRYRCRVYHHIPTFGVLLAAHYSSYCLCWNIIMRCIAILLHSKKYSWIYNVSPPSAFMMCPKSMRSFGGVWVICS